MPMPWTVLKQHGILGMNRRNADYVVSYQKRHLYPLVDDKRRTKLLAQAAGIPAPELYDVVEIEHQIRDFAHKCKAWQDFVIKPANGSGGNGIIVVTGHTPTGRLRRASGRLISMAEAEHHLSNVLSGMYSLGGSADVAMIEYCVKFDPVFDSISYQGVPDIRTIVYRGIPVMAMIRLPTQASDGKANLHQGAVGVGINMATGKTTQGVHQNSLLSHHPDTGAAIGNRDIPCWREILTMAARCHDIAPLDYLGVDIVLDKDKGPLLLELNARPGLNIQLCNNRGLLPILARVERLKNIPPGAAERVELALLLAERNQREHHD